MKSKKIYETTPKELFENIAVKHNMKIISGCAFCALINEPNSEENLSRQLNESTKSESI